MKRVLLLTTIGVLFCVAYSQAQNVFNPSDPIVRPNTNATYGTAARPDSLQQGLQKWVATVTNGVSTGSNSFDASSYKAYFINLGGAKMPFRLKFPKSFNNPDSAGKKYPVMIFFHGAGEPACPSNGKFYNNEKQLLHGGKLFRDYVDQNKFDGFLMYPQAVSGTNNCWLEWGIAPFAPYYNLVINVLDSLAKYSRLDVDKVITTGLSNGGSTAWGMAAAFPTRVTKAAPSASVTGADYFSEYVHIPTWFATGGKDTNPNLAQATTTYNNIKNAGADIRWTMYPNLGHSVWYDHWQENGFTQWMSDMHKANPLVYFQRNEICPDSVLNVRIGISRGFYEYEWRRDGVKIASAVRTSAVQSQTTFRYTYTYNTTIEPGQGGPTGPIISYTANDIQVRSYGTYSVRFRRYQGGDWSEWSPKPAVISPKTITNTPPIALDGFVSKVLPAPDGSTTAPLILPVGYNKYEWYRNDVLVDTGRRFAAIPGAYKAKAYEPFGCGSVFSPVFNVIAANGEPKPDPALNLKAEVENLVNIRLSWSQNPNAGQNETGFEIYRSTGGSGGPYQLLAITPADASSYLDANRPSNQTFYYVMRAIGDFGASALTEEASATTPSDVVAPTAPSGLNTTCVTRDRVTLKWSASTDNVGVAVYDIYVNDEKWYSTSNLRFEVFGLSPMVTYRFSVKAKDAAGNASQPSNQINALTKAQGVCYKVYQGDWEFLPDFYSLTPVAEGMTDVPSLSVVPAGITEHFGILFEGHIFRSASQGEDTHRFRTCSDDGSKFYMNMYYNPNSNGGNSSVNNDGVHTEECVQGASTQNLAPSTGYPFALAYFNKTGAGSLALNWRVENTGGNSAWTAPTAANYTQNTSGTHPTPPSAIPANLQATTFNYKQINLGWGDISNETAFELVRATNAAGPFEPLATIPSGTTTYQDTGLNASTQYWYRVRAINNGGQSGFSNTANATTSAPPPGPTAPTNLTAGSPALATVQLTWNDNSANETGFEIWRSSGNNTAYELLTTVPASPGTGQRVYLDEPVFANVAYFYKVRAAGAPTPSGYTGEVSISTANSAPVLNPVSDFSVRQGSSVTVSVNATDVDGDPLTFIAPALPYFAQIQNVSNGNANIVVNPPMGEQGGYTLRLIVDDGYGGRDTVRFTIVVNDNNLPALNPINDITINEGDSLTIPITATDAENSQYFTWSFKNKPSWVTFTNTNGAGQLKLKPGYAASGIYNMTVIVDDGFGAWTSRSFSIVVNETNPNESIQIDFGFWTQALPQWNVIPLQNGPTFQVNNLRNRKNEVTTVGIRSLTTGGGISGGDHGTAANGVGVYPDQVIRTQLKVGYCCGGSDQMQIEVYGLDATKKYNFIFFASDNGTEAWRGYNANSYTEYVINGVTARVYVLNNISNTDTIYQVSPNAQGRVVINVNGDPAGNVGAILNALIVEKQFDDGTTPAKPENLQAQVIPNVGVRLQWNDIAYNENSYKIFRATSEAGPYTELLPSALRDSVGYLDASVQPYTQYYYFVRGENHLGLGASSDTVGALTGNNSPMIVGLSDLYLKTGTTGQDDFSVTDNEGETVTVSLKNKPSFVTLSSLGGNNYRITAQPTIDHIGWHYITVVTKDNLGAEREQQMSITVADADTRSVFINFDRKASAPAPWNNVVTFGNAGTTLNNLRDETNTVTPFGVVLVTGWNGVTDMGQRTGNNSGIFPDSVLAGGLWTGNVTSTVRFTGLNNSMRYNITLVGSLNSGRFATARYVSGSQSDTLNPTNNSAGGASLNNLTPTNGVIEVSIIKLPGARWTVLNGAQLEEFAPASGIMKPLNLYVEARVNANGSNATSTSLIWKDRSSNETGFQVQRANDSLFTSGVDNDNINTAGFNIRSNTGNTAGLTANQRYWYRVRATGPNSTFSDWSNKVKVIIPQTTVSMNFNFSIDDEAAPWNNTTALPNFLNTFAGLLNSSSQPTSMTMSIEKIFNGEYAFGLRPSNGVVPANVMEASYWIDRGQVAEVRMRGLNQDKRYRFGFTGGIDRALFGDTVAIDQGDFTMTYTINGRTVYLNSFYNENKMVWIGDIVPSESGEVLIQFSTPDRESLKYGFTSGMVIQSYDDPIGGQVPNVMKPVGNVDVVLQTPGSNVPELEVITKDGLSVKSKMYPNPFQDQINLDFNNTAAGDNISVDVYDLSGKLVYRRNFGKLPAGLNTLRVNTADGRLNSGVYMVTLVVNGKPVQATKMIKDRR